MTIARLSMEWRQNVPLGMLALFLGYRFVADDRRAAKIDRTGFDHVGTLLLALTLAAYALAMTTGQGSFGLLNVVLLSTAVVGGAGLFARAQARAAAPLVHLAMFRQPALGAGFAMSAPAMPCSRRPTTRPSRPISRQASGASAPACSTCRAISGSSPARP